MGTYVDKLNPNYFGYQAANLLDEGWTDLGGKADAAFNAATDLANTLSSAVDFSEININTGTQPTLSVSNLSMPGDIEAPNIYASKPSINTALGASITPVSTPTFADAPVFSSVVPAFSFTDKPIVTQPTNPGDAPIVVDRSMPDSPDIDLPSVPTLRDINLPDVPDILLPTFSGVSPSGDVPELVSPNFMWTEADYTEKLPQLASKIANYLAFDFDAAETAIWERGQDRVDRATNEAVNEISNDFAARGFSLPVGSMLAAINEARMKGAEAKYDNARDAMIKAAELNTQKLTIAIQSGIQYEGMWMQNYSQYLQRAFEAQRYSADLAMKVAELKISRFNIRLQAYQIEAQVHRDLIQAELAKLETYKAQIEGQKLIGDLNIQDVEIYKARLQGTMAEIELYKNQVQAVVATIEVDKARLQGYESKVNAFKAMVDANAAEYGAWAELMKGEVMKGQIFESEAKAFASRTDAYRTGVGAQIDAARLSLENNAQKIQQFNSVIANYDAELRGYSAEIDAEARQYSARVQYFDSLLKGVSLDVDTQVKIAGFNLDKFRVQSGVSIEEARANVQMTQEEVRLSIAKLDAAGKIYAQLAASAMSAFNLSASASYSDGKSVSNSLSEAYSASV